MQLSTFNNANMESNYVIDPVSITVTPLKGSPGILATGNRRRSPFESRFGYNPMMMGATSQLSLNQGAIRIYPLGEQVDTLPSGKYRVTVALSPAFDNRTEESIITIHQSATTKPAATEPADSADLNE